jgi:hypothetical protein
MRHVCGRIQPLAIHFNATVARPTQYVYLQNAMPLVKAHNKFLLFVGACGRALGATMEIQRTCTQWPRRCLDYQTQMLTLCLGRWSLPEKRRVLLH